MSEYTAGFRKPGEPMQKIPGADQLATAKDQIATLESQLAATQQRLAECEMETQKLVALLPEAVYMDPPDGGNVTVAEQFRRMAEDAESYLWGVHNARWIRHEYEAYVAIPVAVDADLSCPAMMIHAIDKARGAK